MWSRRIFYILGLWTARGNRVSAHRVWRRHRCRTLQFSEPTTLTKRRKPRRDCCERSIPKSRSSRFSSPIRSLRDFLFCHVRQLTGTPPQSYIPVQHASARILRHSCVARSRETCKSYRLSRRPAVKFVEAQTSKRMTGKRRAWRTHALRYTGR
jgi:hypothetical protein